MRILAWLLLIGIGALWVWLFVQGWKAAAAPRTPEEE